MAYTIVTAKTNRCHCKHCGKQIDRKEWKMLYFAMTYIGNMSYSLCMSCAIKFLETEITKANLLLNTAMDKKREQIENPNATQSILFGAAGSTVQMAKL